MDILLLTPQLPFPPRQGTALRNWGLLRHLAARQALSLLTFEEPGSSAPPAELAAVCRSVTTVPRPKRGLAARLRSVLAGRADLADRLWSPAFDQALRRLIGAQHYDLVQIEGLELGHYLATVRTVAPRLPIVYDAHNAEITLQARAMRSDLASPSRWAAAAYSWLQVGRLRRFESSICGQADAVSCVSDTDAAALRRLVPGLAPTVVPNGIELADYPAPPQSAPAEVVLTFTGKMDYRPNVDAALWFARDVWPRVRQRLPNARFDIVGQSPAPAIERLAAQAGIRVVGAVADTRPFIAASSVYVAPLRMGGGTRFKLLEALALCRPVVSTTLGAEGFAIQSGRELLIADTAASFAENVLQIIGDSEKARQLGLAGRAFVAASYDWAAIAPRMELMDQAVVNRSAVVAG